jgi:hypothetical protein
MKRAIILIGCGKPARRRFLRVLLPTECGEEPRTRLTGPRYTGSPADRKMTQIVPRRVASFTTGSERVKESMAVILSAAKDLRSCFCCTRLRRTAETLRFAQNDKRRAQDDSS